MAISYPPYPIPVVVEDGKDGYTLYIESGGQYENDIWTVVHKDGGIVRHYNSSQIRVLKNSTFDITKTQPDGDLIDP